MNKIELLSPAGDLERLKIAILYGANAVYVGGKKFSLRSRASNFDIEDIAQGVAFANQHNAKIHVTVNMLPHQEDLDGLAEYLKELERVGVSAIIAASPSIAMCAKKVAPKLEVHLSTQHSSTNSQTIAFWKEQGVDRVVLGRECSLAEIKATTLNASLPVEVFIHGGMCISYSGRCTLSNHMTSRDANRGGCAQSCRWKYTMYEKEKVISDSKELFSMSSKDLMAAKYIQDLIECKVTSLKIEGRMKSAYYIATVVRAYRMLIDAIYENKVDQAFMEFIYDELNRAENRPTALGFYEGLPRSVDQLYGVNGAGVTQEFIASVLEYDEKRQMSKIVVRNYFTSGTPAQVFGPNQTTEFMIGTCYDEDNEVVEVANKPMQVLWTVLPPCQPFDMIRKVIDKSDRRVY